MSHVLLMFSWSVSLYFSFISNFPTDLVPRVSRLGRERIAFPGVLAYILQINWKCAKEPFTPAHCFVLSRLPFDLLSAIPGNLARAFPPNDNVPRTPTKCYYCFSFYPGLFIRRRK